MRVLRGWVLAVLVPLGAVAPAERAAAQQQTATIQARAMIEDGLGGSAVRDLELGTVMPGVPQTVAPQDVQSCAGCASGLWIFPNLSTSNGASRRYIRITYSSLPAVLTSSTGTTLPLAWTNAARGCVTRAGTELHCTTTTPVSGGSTSFVINGPAAPAAVQPGTTGRDFLLYLGGTAVPAPGQMAGHYAGTVTIRFQYANN